MSLIKSRKFKPQFRELYGITVPSQDNPADCASRGLSPNSLVNHQLWWQGPRWLRLESTLWPTSSERIHNLPKERVRVLHISMKAPVTEPEELLRFSSLRRLLRITSWCRRWFVRAGEEYGSGKNSESRDFGYVSAEELGVSRIDWFRLIQTLHFGEAIKSVCQGLGPS